MKLELVNEGAPIRELLAVSKGDYDAGVPHPADVLQTGQTVKIPITYTVGPPTKVILELSFIDTTGESRRVSITADTIRQTAQTREV